MTILIVDDHAAFRTFVHGMLDDEGFDVIGDAANGESAVEAARRLHPDLALVDVQLGDGIDGFEVARQLAALPDPPKVVLTSSRDEADFASRIAEAPIEGFLAKDEISGASLKALFHHPLAG